MGSTWPPAVERSARVVFGRGIPWVGAKGEFILKAGRPTVVDFVFGEVDAAVVPGVAVAAVSRFHGDEGSFGGIAGGVLEEGAGGAGLVFATIEEGGDGGDAAGFADLAEE